jgi:DNA-binding NarL/FixJ family response regulator
MKSKQDKQDGPERPTADIFTERKSFVEFQKIFSDYLVVAGDKISLKDRMEVTLQLSFAEAIITNTDRAKVLLQECEEYILANGKPEEKAAVYHIRCRLHLQHSDHEQALADGVRSLYLFQQLDFPFFTMNTCTCCGVVCAKLNLFTEAIDYLTRSHAIAMQMGDRKAAILCTANLNDIRLNVLPMEDCIKLNLELLARIKEEFGSGPSTSEAGTCLQLTYLYMKTDQLDLAERFAERSLSVLVHLSHLPPHHFLYTNLYGVRAEIAGHRGDEAGMLRNAKECSERARLISKISPEIDILFIQFRFYLRQQDVARAKELLDRASVLIPDTDRGAHYITLCENRCLYYHAIGDMAAEMAQFKLVHESKMKAQQEALASRSRYMTTIYELEMIQKESEMRKQELDFKTQELNMTNYYLQQRNHLLEDLQESLDKLKKERSPADVIVKAITEKIKQASAIEESEKTRFKDKFDESQREFIARLHEAHTYLSTTECRVCALLRSGFNTKEIANLLSSSTRTIENHRANIRRKMNLGRTDNLNMILTEIK